MLSFWESESLLHADYIIIGSGITGLSVAASLLEKDPACSVLVLERSGMPYGASSRNAGFACFGSLTEVLSDIDLMGEENARELLFQRWLGLQITRKRLGEQSIGFEESGGFELIERDRLSDLKASIEQVNALLEDFLPAYLSVVPEGAAKLGMVAEGYLVSMDGEGQVHTGKLMASLMQHVSKLGAQLRTGQEVKAFDRHHVRVIDPVRGELTYTAKEVVLCTNAFASHRFQKQQMVPGRGQVFITDPISNLRFAGNLHLDEGYYYLRNVGDRLLFGGARNLDFFQEQSHDFELNDQIQIHLEQKLNQLFGADFRFSVAQRWSGIMAFGADKRPIIGRDDQGVMVAVKMGGMGIALAGFVGEEVGEILMNER